MCGDDTISWEERPLPADVQEYLDAQMKSHMIQARLENEYTTSPVITVNGEHVAWLNSPLLVNKDDRQWVDRVRAQPHGLWNYTPKGH